MNTEIQSKRILLIDDHPICGCGLNRVIQTDDAFTLAYHASASHPLPTDVAPDIIILEISSANNQGLTLLKKLKDQYAKIPVLVLSAQAESLFASRCLKAGARGYLMKSATENEILDALQTVASGKIYTSPSLKEQLLNQISGGSYSSNLPSLDALSDRELLIVQRIGQSRNNGEIAKELSISTKTIESHRSRIKTKLKLTSPNELVRYAVRLQDSAF